MKTRQIIFSLGVIALLTGCGNKAADKMSYEAAADSTTVNMSSSAAVENPGDSTHKFIRTANLKFRVNNVAKATTVIEDITARMGGYVASTNLSSNKDNVKTTEISSDSTLETTYYTVTNDMVLRVPNVKLDTTLRQLACLVTYLDYRVIKADDVSLQVLTNKLTQKRAKTAESRLAKSIDTRGKKLGETAAAEETLQNKQEAADNAFVENLSLEDQMKYSTINLSVYQRQGMLNELIPNEKNVEAYQPGFFLKLWEAIKVGWVVISELFLFIVKLWGLILMAGIVYLLYKIYFAKKKESQE
ncbi:DUF4349 domain-containing protein [Parabacteroides sp. FAFU027]|uniref:DUF4349 domain-containing protein n=1 Tax=Parabacteroides sp. FAFU027 TaxID=2922715 RepID=UPI001FAE8050|nr:DUF4349 domain-containing protein [Parabacteroides sp. FAFU027]